MAGPIRISILADVGRAVRDLTRFNGTTEDSRRVITGLSDSRLTGGFGRVQEGFDLMDTRAMGFRDTITGVQDSMTAWQALTTSTKDATDRVAVAQQDYNDAVAKYGENSAQALEANSRLSEATEALDTQQKSLGDKILLLGTGVGDLASGMTNFIVPMLAMSQAMTVLSLSTARATAAAVAHRVVMIASTIVTGAWTAAQWLLNAAMYANPIGLVILVIVALIAAIVLAWKHSETFRNIVTGAFNAVWGAIKAVWGWVKGNWPLLLSILTGPIGLAVRWIIQHWNQIITTASAIPGRIKSAIGNLGGLLVDAGRSVVRGFIDGITGMFGAVRDKLSSLTSMLPSWKGPAERDRKVLFGTGQMVIGGFLRGLESQYSGVQSSLGGFTNSLTTDAAVTGTVRVEGSKAPGWAQRLETLLDGGITLTLESSGNRGDDALLELIRERVTVKGGRGTVLGITA